MTRRILTLLDEMLRDAATGLTLLTLLTRGTRTLQPAVARTQTQRTPHAIRRA